MQRGKTVRHLVWTFAFLATIVASGSASAEQAATAGGLSCSAIDGVGQVIAPATILLIGEMHGTEQSPPFVNDLVCTALDRGLPVTVSLEIPVEEADRLAAYLDSDGGQEARAALLTGPFWTSEYQDGRQSAAMLQLIDSLRRDQAAGLPVNVALLDNMKEKPNGRDAFLASQLVEAAKAAPRDLVIALTGNLHSRVRKGSPWDNDFRPMGLDVEEQLPDRRVLAFDVAFTGGTAWNCRGDSPEGCHVYELNPPPMDGSGERRIVLDDSVQGHHFDGYYTVGSLTASPPAFRPEPPAQGGSEP